MSYSYSNLLPNQSDVEVLYADCESYLIGETLPDFVMGSSVRKDWVQSEIANSEVQTQIIKDGKVVCLFAGKINDGLADYNVALVSPDINGSRSFWYSPDFWGVFESALKANGLVGWMCNTLEGTSLHSTLSASVQGKTETTEKLFSVDSINLVNIKYQLSTL